MEEITLPLAVQSGGGCKLMLMDGNWAPLCEAREVRIAVVSAAGRVRTGLPKNDGWTYKLMLVDQNYAPLLPAWEKTLAELK